MARVDQCKFCEGFTLTVINTYKHRWFSCNDCGNIFRQKKAKYLLEFIPENVFKVIPSRKARRFLSSTLKRKSDCAIFYDYYLDETQGQSVTSKGTKWEGQADKLVLEMKKLGINLTGKNILDISGGPGFLAQELSPLCKKVFVTEYSEIAVDRISKHLGISAIKYDFNNDDIGSLIHEKFDVVLIRYAINFCFDIRKMLGSLKKVLNKDAIVYVSFVPPTLGACLRWQFDDYTYHILYNPETMRRLFTEEGLVAFAKYDDGSFSYLNGFTFKLLAPFIVAYRAFNLFKKCNQELIQKNLVMIFKWSRNTC